MLRYLLMNKKNYDKIAIIENDKEIPYKTLINKAFSLQHYLPKDAKENIALFLPNGSDFIMAYWGTISAGMTAFPLNVLMTEYELAPLLKYADVKTIITSTAYRKLFEETTSFESLSLEIIYMEEIKISSYENNFSPTDVGENDPMLLLNTSGTTGEPKIVQLSEKNVEVSTLGYLDKVSPEAIPENDVRYVLAVPYSSVYGIMILSACLIKEYPLVLLDEVFTLGNLYKTVEKHRVTHYEGSTSTLILMEQMIDKSIPYDIETLKYFGFGGSNISGNAVKRLHDTYNEAYFYHGYGMTEASPLIAKHPRGIVSKMNSVGTAIKGMEISVDTDSGITHIPCTKGEIVVRGANVMLGYYNNDHETDNVLKNGYLYTGDIGYLDEEGYLYICGRKKNIIIVRGFNVFPEEVEDCIRNSMLAKDCFVYGQPDNMGNEIVCADIVLKHQNISKEQIWTHLREHLADYKLPKRIYFCDSIEKNLLGKIQRKKGDS